MMSDADVGPDTPARGDPESLGIRVFEFIVADVDRIIQFMNITGLQPETLREAANAPDFLLGVLEYASKDDELLKLIHTELGIPPGTILAATWHQAPVPGSASGTDKKAERHPLPPRRSLFE
jgi:uncharacterized protein DUF3572